MQGIFLEECPVTYIFLIYHYQFASINQNKIKIIKSDPEIVCFSIYKIDTPSNLSSYISFEDLT